MDTRKKTYIYTQQRASKPFKPTDRFQTNRIFIQVRSVLEAGVNVSVIKLTLQIKMQMICEAQQ